MYLKPCILVSATTHLFFYAIPPFLTQVDGATSHPKFIQMQERVMSKSQLKNVWATAVEERSGTGARGMGL